MKEEDFLPAFVLETETGKLRAIYDIEELRLMVEEFWDILKNDFKFWDVNGYPLEFEQAFLDKRGVGIKRTGASESQIVRSLIMQSAKDTPGLPRESEESLINLYEQTIVKEK